METPEATPGSTTDKFATIDPSVETVKAQPSVETVKAQPTEDELKEFEEFKKNKAHFQSIAERQRTELSKQLEDARIQAMEEKVRREAIEKSLHPEVELKPPVEPVEPIPPDNYDELDAMDVSTPSGQYKRKFNQYSKDLAKYNRDLMVYNQRQLQEESKELKTYLEEVRQKKQVEFLHDKWVNEYMNEGLTQEEAEKAFQFFSSHDSILPKTHVQIFKLINQKNGTASFKAPETITGTPGENVNKDHYFKKADPGWMFRTK